MVWSVSIVTKLLNTKCSSSHKSNTVLLVHAAVNDKGVLERIRPLPIRLSPGIWFNLCKKGGRTKYCPDGDTCTNAHSRAEQDAWNAQLVDPEGDWKISELFKMTLHAITVTIIYL